MKAGYCGNEYRPILADVGRLFFTHKALFDNIKQGSYRIMQSHASDIQMDFAAAHTKSNRHMKISEMRALLRSICPTDPLMQRWLISQGYPPEGPMYRQPALSHITIVRVVASKVLIFLFVIQVTALAFGTCAAIMLAINSFTKPVDTEPFYQIMVCALAFLAMPTFIWLTVRILAAQLKSDGRIEYEVRDLADAQSKADKLRHALNIGPDDDISAIWAARWLYETFRDFCAVNAWEMESLFRTFGLENCPGEAEDIPEDPESRRGDVLGLYGGWHDNNYWDDYDDPGEWWKYR